MLCIVRHVIYQNLYNFIARECNDSCSEIPQSNQVIPLLTVKNRNTQKYHSLLIAINGGRDIFKCNLTSCAVLNAMKLANVTQLIENHIYYRKSGNTNNINLNITQKNLDTQWTTPVNSWKCIFNYVKRFFFSFFF